VVGKSNKGPKFERDFCKELSLWWTYGEMDDVFWRTAGSGARATTRMKKGIRTADSYGDITSLRSNGKPLTKTVLLELKRGYTGKKGKKSTRYISILDLIDTPENKNRKKEPVIMEWWKDAQVKRKEAGRKRVFIIFRRDRKNTCIMMSRSSFKQLEKINGPMIFPPYCWNWINYNGKEFMVFTTDHFFGWCDPASMGARVKKPKTIRKIKKLRRRN